MPGLRQVDLADQLDVEPITLCRIIDRLEDAGLVARRRDPEDRRAWRLEVTEKAVPLVEQLRALGDELRAEAFAGIDGDALEAVRSNLAKMRENIAAVDNGPQGRMTA
jgi:DNA-binding MarR family transcriptional regulator